MNTQLERVHFADRAEAGELLGESLSHYRGADVLVLGLARGGVPVAARVATLLDAELDVLVARKLGAPISAELAIGAVTADGERMLNEGLIGELGVPAAYVSSVTQRQMAEARKAHARLRGGRAAPRLAGRIVILVDDGLATGATMLAAARSVRRRGPARLIVAVPVASHEARGAVAHVADEVVCLDQPEPFHAVGASYGDFRPTTDDEVRDLLVRAWARRGVEPW